MEKTQNEAQKEQINCSMIWEEHTLAFSVLSSPRDCISSSSMARHSCWQCPNARMAACCTASGPILHVWRIPLARTLVHFGYQVPTDCSTPAAASQPMHSSMLCFFSHLWVHGKA